MKIKKQIAKQKQRRQFRVRNHVRRSAHGRMRLSVYRSNKHIYAQVIDDENGVTVVSAASNQKDVCPEGVLGSNVDGARAVGATLAQRAAEKGIKAVVFDRGQYKFHGRVAALAAAAREAGLEF